MSKIAVSRAIPFALGELTATIEVLQTKIEAESDVWEHKQEYKNLLLEFKDRLNTLDVKAGFKPGRETYIYQLGLSEKAFSRLMENGIRTLGDLLNLTEADYLAFKNAGRKSLAEIKERLAGFGYKLKE